jgi:hypothetical protein
MLRFLIDLFSDCAIAVHDGDGSCAANATPHGGRLRGLIRSRLHVTPISLIHSASTHYLSRDFCGPSRRFWSAFNDLADALYRDSPTGALCLRRTGDNEWTGNVSEVLGVGLATEIMCQVLPAKVANVVKIRATGTRCDFSVVTQGFTAVYEARGRNSRAMVTSASSRLPTKKAAHIASYKYGIVSALPNDGAPVESFIFDPPGEENLKPPTIEQWSLQLARHYRKVAARAGLGTLASAIGKRIEAITKQERWISEPLLQDLPGLRKEIRHEGRIFLVGEETPQRELVQHIEPPLLEDAHTAEKPRRQAFDLEFGIDSLVADALRRWEFAKLAELPLKAHAASERLLNVAGDGSILRVIPRM